jgi:ubiquinol-cytochrome c reductase cytochrome b subunit
MTTLTDRTADALARTRLGTALNRMRAEAADRRFQPTWSNLLGAASWGSGAVLLISGVILMFFYAPSSELIEYHGGYAPLAGAEVSRAYASTLALSVDVPGGLLLRQTHHWAGLLLPATLILQLATTFFSGAFRGRRRWAWALLVLLIIAVLADGWSGYALPDDMLSGTGLRIVEGIVLGIPIVGTWMATLLFGGGFPGTIIETLYPLHVAIVPVAIVLLVVLRLRVLWTAGPARVPVAGRARLPLTASAAARRAGLVATLTAGLTLLMGATVTISPVWLSGPSDPAAAGAGSQPDWYTGFLDGALRLVPPGWEVEWLDRTWTLAVLVPLAVIGAFVLAVLVHPWVEAWLVRDPSDPDLLDRPRNMPVRTGLGVAAVIFYATLWGAASADVSAALLHLQVESVVAAFQVGLFASPVLGFVFAHRIARGLQRRDDDLLAHGFETGRIVRLPGGEYIEAHHALPTDSALALHTRPTHDEPARRPGGSLRWPLDRLRVALGAWYLAGARWSAPESVTPDAVEASEEHAAVRAALSAPPGRTAVPARVLGMSAPSRSASSVGAAGLVVGGLVCQEVGAGIAVTLFPQVGPLGMVTLRLVFSALILLLVFRPTLRSRSRGDWLTVLAFGLVLAVMNSLFYLALDRLHLGATVTIEYLGPLVLSVVVARRASAWLWAVLAFAGVALLGRGGFDQLDPLGVALALGAGVAWVGYILLSARTGARFGRLDGLAVAMAVGAIVSLPFGLTSGGAALLNPLVLLIGLGVAVLSSAIPYGLELIALRRLPASTFSILLSLAPALAALAGLVILHQQLAVLDVVAIALVVVASMGAVRSASARRAEPAAGPELAS